MKKRAIEKIMSIWWFSIWVIIIVAVIINVALFSNREIDYRSQDSKALFNKVRGCLVEEEIDFSQGQEKIREDFIERCKINFVSFSSQGYSLKLEINSKEINIGPPGMFTQCEIKENVNANKYPECFEGEIEIEQKNTKYAIKIFSASNLNGKRVLAKDIQ